MHTPGHNTPQPSVRRGASGIPLFDDNPPVAAAFTPQRQERGWMDQYLGPHLTRGIENLPIAHLLRLMHPSKGEKPTQWASILLSILRQKAGMF